MQVLTYAIEIGKEWVFSFRSFYFRSHFAHFLYLFFLQAAFFVSCFLTNLFYVLCFSGIPFLWTLFFPEKLRFFWETFHKSILFRIHNFLELQKHLNAFLFLLSGIQPALLNLTINIISYCTFQKVNVICWFSFTNFDLFVDGMDLRE